MERALDEVVEVGRQADPSITLSATSALGVSSNSPKVSRPLMVSS
ncbi:hypothetical protein ACFQV4_17425 [Streptomyces thermocarboxydus]